MNNRGPLTIDCNRAADRVGPDGKPFGRRRLNRVVRRCREMNNDTNPYASPTTASETPYVCIHYWRNRTIAIRAGYLPRRIWMLGGFAVTIDDSETFSSAQWSYNEDSRWQFQHNNRVVCCHLRTKMSPLSVFQVRYELSIDGEPSSSHVVRLSGAWCNFLVIPAGLTLLAGLVYLAVRGLV
jgi:hypothetical protein